MTPDQAYITKQFARHFAGFENKTMAIYGLGKNTPVILDSFPGFHIAGLLDEVRTGDTVFGKKVLSLDEARGLGVDTILILATQSNTRIIYRRIEAFCAGNHIAVYDINGRDLRALAPAAGAPFDSAKYAPVSRQALRRKIDAADVVSFDIFDTLLMRRVLYPPDIFSIVEDRAKTPGFAKARVRAEMELYTQAKNARLDEIYLRLQEALSLADDEREHLYAAELAAEEQALVPRKAMCEMAAYAARQGKQVFFVSDMYLPSDFLSRLLQNAGVPVAAQSVFVSCAHGMGKAGGLFSVLRKAVGQKHILHVGDDHDADMAAAAAYGIEDTFRIYKASEMLEDSPARGLLSLANSTAARMVVGTFLASALSDPFLFSETGGKFRIASTRDMAYTYFAPLVYKFFAWMQDTAKERQLELVLLGARDGWIFKEIAAMLQAGPGLPVPMPYFYTSRAVAFLAGIQNEGDILSIAHVGFSGTAREMLSARFLLLEEEILPRLGEEPRDGYILRHKAAILKNAAEMRKNHLTYIETLGIRPGAKVGFMDFVSTGSCQRCLAEICSFHATGLYFVRIEDPEKAHLPIEALFGQESCYTSNTSLSENYLHLENVFTAPEPTLACFTAAGKPVFMPEVRTEKQLAALHAIHSAILDYGRDNGPLLGCFSACDAQVADKILSFLSEQYSEMQADYFEVNDVLCDEVMNRTFPLMRPAGQ